MRSAAFLLAALALTGCGFDEPPAPPSGGVLPAASLAPVTDPCTDVALTLLDGQLNGLPSAQPDAYDKGGRVADAFQARYDAVIASSGVPAARAQYAAEVQAACAG